MKKYMIAHKTNRSVEQILSRTHDFIYQEGLSISSSLSDFIQYNTDVAFKIEEFEDEPTDSMINSYLNSKLKSKLITLYIDLDDTIFDFMKAKEDMQRKTGMTFPQATYGFFANLEPFEGAIEAIKELIDDPSFNVKFATAPSTYNPMSYTEKRVCIEKHFGFEHVDKLFILSEKDRLDQNEQGYPSILIDDCKIGYGQENYNAQILFGSSEYKDWKDIKSVLIGSIF